MSQNGKGDKPRISNYKKYQDNYSDINWSNKKNNFTQNSLNQAAKEFCEENGDALLKAAQCAGKLYSCHVCGSTVKTLTEFNNLCGKCADKIVNN